MGNIIDRDFFFINVNIIHWEYVRNVMIQAIHR